MTTFIAENMAPIMFFALIVLLLIGYPVAFALALNGIAFGLIGIELGIFAPSLFQALPERLFAIMGNETLLAIPFFTFMGLILERSGMAEDLLDTVGQLFGPVRGGLAYAVVLVGALLGAVTGVVAASVIAMGLISVSIMLRYGYDRRLTSGVIAASGTLTQIIPPSLVLIVMADQLGRSVGDMYAGAIIPSLVLTGLYLIYIFLVTLARPEHAPALPVAARTFAGGAGSLIGMLVLAVGIGFAARWWMIHAGVRNASIWAATAAVVAAYLVAIADRGFKLGLLSRLTEQLIVVLMPPLALIFLVLGTIFLGLATPTEGGAMGAVGALVMAAAKRRLNMPILRHAVEATARLSAFVIFILIGARVFSLTFYGVGGNLWVEQFLVNLPGGEIGFLIVVNLLVFVLAFFLDFFELAFIIVPLLAPAAAALGIDLVWFGVLLGVNMQTSFMHPPFGFALFYLRSVAPRESYVDSVTGARIAGITSGQIYWGAVPFVVIQIIMIGLTIAFPQMVMVYQGPARAPSEIEIRLPQPAGRPGVEGPPSFGAPDLSQPPSFGTPRPKPPPSAPDLSQPPSFD